VILQSNLPISNLKELRKNLNYLRSKDINLRVKYLSKKWLRLSNHFNKSVQWSTFQHSTGGFFYRSTYNSRNNCHLDFQSFYDIYREWQESGQLWVQQVSSTPATRLDVVNLQEELDRRLQQRQARETGICPVRRELYSQCFG
jgi:hypothetical protein